MGRGDRPGREAAREESGEGKPGAILERLHQPVARKFVAPQRERCVEVRGVVEAAPAQRAGGAGKRAARARFGKRGQFGDAGRAQQLRSGFRPAEQAVFASPGLGVSYAGVESRVHHYLNTFWLTPMIVS